MRYVSVDHALRKKVVVEEKLHIHLKGVFEIITMRYVVHALFYHEFAIFEHGIIVCWVIFEHCFILCWAIFEHCFVFCLVFTDKI